MLIYCIKPQKYLVNGYVYCKIYSMMKSDFKIAIAQVSTVPGDITGNVIKIIQNIDKANKESAQMVIFPELAIPGYMSLDLMLYPKYIEDNLKGLDQIVAVTGDIYVIVGFINQDKNKLGPDGTPVRYNCAAIIHDHKLIGIQDKTLLPDYDVFFENRYFATGNLRKIIEIEGIKFGIQICEDLWDENYPIKVSNELVDKGAQILINISGSPYYADKRLDREKLIKKVSAKYKVPFVYVNTVGVQDGYDGQLIFDGQSMVLDSSEKLILLGKKFEEDLIFTDTGKLFGSNNPAIELPNTNLDEELTEALTLAIKEYFKMSSFSKAFIGLSGGIDSAVVAALAVEALGADKVTGIFMPSIYSSKTSLEDAKQLAQNLGINFEVIEINEIFNDYLESLKEYFKGLPVNEAEENLQARIRGIILMAHANKFKGLVISTANKTEMALGYSTLYGDMCGAISPLADVSKTTVYKIAKVINAKKEIIPERSITKVPTAELRENQSDEESLGASYEIISPLVDELIEGLDTKEQLAKKYPLGVIEHLSKLITQNEYKRRQAAPGVKVTKKSFGIGRRIPLAYLFEI